MDGVAIWAPGPFSCWKMQERFYESGSCVPKNLCHLRGSPQFQGPTGVQNLGFLG